MSGCLPLLVSMLLAGPAPTQEVDDVAALQAFFDRHDQLVRDWRVEDLRDLYKPCFLSTDLGVAGREEMLHQWAALLQSCREVQLRTQVLRVDRVGSWRLVSACRPFRAKDAMDGAVMQDDLCESMLVQVDEDGAYQIAQILELDHDKLAFLQADGATWRRKDLGFAVKAPADWLPVAHRTAGSRLDKVVFLQPEWEARIDFSVMDPTLPLHLEQAITEDLWVDDRCRWECKPEARKLEGPAVKGMTAVYGAVSLDRKEFGEELAEDLVMGSWYLSPDGRVLFALTAKAPRQAWPRTRAALTEVVRSLTFVDPPAEYSKGLFDRQPDWNTVKDGFYEHGSGHLVMEIPAGLRAVPLAGGSLQRLRLELEEDPGSSLLLQVYEPEWMDAATEKRLEQSVQRLVGTVCDPSDVRGEDKLTNLEFLDQEAPLRVLCFTCHKTGTCYTHRLLSTHRDGYYVQLILIAGSDRVELQRELFAQAAAALIWD